MERKMVFIGKQTVIDMLDEIPLSKNEVGKKIGLTKGGFWHVTHKSGKMNKKTWEKFKKVYLEYNKKLPEIGNLDSALSGFDNDALVEELESRGYEVFLRKVKKARKS
ncbi:MAG: hypothetical protein ACPGJV_09805 [Bacteriovoracaceae bacterium]